MYGLSKRMLAFLCATAVAFGVLTVVTAAEVYPGLETTARPVPEIHIDVCAGYIANVRSTTAFYVVTLVLETVFFVMALLKCIQLARGRSTIVAIGRTEFIWDLLFRDTLIYFFAIFVAYLAATIISTLPITQNQFATPFALALSSIMSERLLLNIREHCNQEVNLSDGGGMSIPSLYNLDA